MEQIKNWQLQPLKIMHPPHWISYIIPSHDCVHNKLENVVATFLGNKHGYNVVVFISRKWDKIYIFSGKYWFVGCYDDMMSYTQGMVSMDGEI